MILNLKWFYQECVYDNEGFLKYFLFINILK